MAGRSLPARPALVVCDVDGTLVTNDKRLTPACASAVADLRRAGIPFTLTSARPPIGMRGLIAELDLVLPLATFNGGMIIGPDLAVLSERLVPADIARAAVAFFTASGFDVWAFTCDRWLITNPAGPYVDHETRTIGTPPTLVAGFDDCIGAFGKLVAVSSDFERLARCEADARERIGGGATIARSQSYYLDVTSTEANKAEALRLLANRLSVSFADIITIGDGRNDIGMLQAAGFGIAMANAPEEVQSAADMVTSSNEDDGFAKAVAFLLGTRDPERMGRKV